jgi:lipoprotein-anchoring transpeptidase ErfK/SrfK
LCEDVKTGEKITREPIYRQTGHARDKSGNDLHNTYIAISIKAQTMWYYKDGKCLLTTPVVTGNISKKMGTPTGVYEIAFKQRDHVLRGQDYESPVDYWMPFYEYRGIGIHDASWRAADAFGKEIYKTNGSHGCVNTPYEAVKTLFETVKTGTPVVVY